jgi:hypothetical protein
MAHSPPAAALELPAQSAYASPQKAMHSPYSFKRFLCAMAVLAALPLAAWAQRPPRTFVRVAAAPSSRAMPPSTSMRSRPAHKSFHGSRGPAVGQQFPMDALFVLWLAIRPNFPQPRFRLVSKLATIWELSHGGPNRRAECSHFHKYPVMRASSLGSARSRQGDTM